MIRVEIWLVMLGGAIGTLARYAVSGALGPRFGESSPYATLAVNVSGCLAIGFFATLTGPEGRLLVPPAWRLAFMTGVCGGYTTFSSFSLQTLNLARASEWLYAGVNIAASVALCLAATWLGHLTASALNR